MYRALQSFCAKISDPQYGINPQARNSEQKSSDWVAGMAAKGRQQGKTYQPVMVDDDPPGIVGAQKAKSPHHVQAVPKPKEADIEEEADEEYSRFICETVESKGLVLDQKAEVGDIAPIDPKMFQTKSQQNSEIDKNFWKDLDALDAILHASSKVETDKGEFKCNICQKKYKSCVKLLQHCWNTHKDQLSKYD